MAMLKGLLIFVLLTYTNCSTLLPTLLKVENLRAPQAINSPNPRLSWILEAAADSDGAIPHNLTQTAYEIVVASNLTLLRSSPDLWNSTKVTSNSTFNIRYQGKVLKAGQTAFWTVRVWDQNGDTSQYANVSISSR